MSYCIGEGCDHPAHLEERMKAVEANREAELKSFLRGSKPNWLKFSDGTMNRRDRRRSQAMERQTLRRSR